MAFNEKTQRDKMRSVFGTGASFKKPNLSPSMTFVDAVPASARMAQQASPYKSMPFRDPWGKSRK